MREMFAQLEATFKNDETPSEYPVNVNIYHKHEKAETKFVTFHHSSWDANFTVTINNQHELNYAKNLLSLYKHLIKPYLKENEQLLKKASERLTRYFYMDIRSDTEILALGKSFVNPETSEFMANAHVPISDDRFLYGIDVTKIFDINEPLRLQPQHNVEIASYYIAHFRDRYRMGKSSKSIVRFHIDLNYFACYAKSLIWNHRND